MTIYNINLGIGWASSGVEYAQLYRAEVLRRTNQQAKFVFLDFISNNNIANLTKNIGFRNDEVIWLYQYFTDVPVSPTTYSPEQLEKTFSYPITRVERQEHLIRYFFDDQEMMATAYLAKNNDLAVERVELVSRGNLIRKDFFVATRLFAEYYSPRDNRAYLYQRKFFNLDGSVAYEEIIDGDNIMYRFREQVFYSKTEFIAYFLTCLKLSSEDVVILDRATDIGNTVIKHSKPAKIGVVVHAEHYSKNYTDSHHILWNNFYEYQFDQARHVDFFVTATRAQMVVLKRQFEQYTLDRPRVFDIPVGSLSMLKKPTSNRTKDSLITASRLAGEKHVDLLVWAVIEAKKQIPNLTFSIYGTGGEEAKIAKIISDNHAENYIKLMGHAKLDDIYQTYEAYISASTSEGFGLTLMEAVGSGLPIVGFNVPYGNQNFIMDGENGYLVPYDEEFKPKDLITYLAEGIMKLFYEDKIMQFSQASYKLAELYLTSEVQEKWENTIREVIND
ncbi:accessory Sec system glycosyltransferase GtfA [Leuconostoc sp. LN180020]|uniref:accessory Sec system glycosyltransferase GtfA n=1 Tax=Leuconostoc sp. LN180020 TaxID=2571156 RepID=UPI00177DC36C|nr:accessory Sec system glycosyltransferase GtfA [Leuconostoc sp. LN180020]QOG10917.1 accessory Sec system glycosyltransferase GtfA [Leuconostoc sp. LN180020]